METFCFILMCLVVLLALFIVLIVILHSRKFIFSIKTQNKKDELLFQVEHQNQDM